MDREQRINALMALLEQRIVMLDGAMGTALDEAGLVPADYGEPRFEGCPEILVSTRPDVILEIHRGYLRAGADIVETDTFGANRLVLGDFDEEAAGWARTLNRDAAAIARADTAAAERQPDRAICHDAVLEGKVGAGGEPEGARADPGRAWRLRSPREERGRSR